MLTEAQKHRGLRDHESGHWGNRGGQLPSGPVAGRGGLPGATSSCGNWRSLRAARGPRDEADSTRQPGADRSPAVSWPRIPGHILSLRLLIIRKTGSVVGPAARSLQGEMRQRAKPPIVRIKPERIMAKKKGTNFPLMQRRGKKGLLYRENVACPGDQQPQALARVLWGAGIHRPGKGVPEGRNCGPPSATRGHAEHERGG